MRKKTHATKQRTKIVVVRKISLKELLRPTHALIDRLRQSTYVPASRREIPFTA